MLEKVQTKNNLPDIPGKIFNFDKSSIQTYKKSDSAITETDLKMFTFYHREKRVKILQ